MDDLGAELRAHVSSGRFQMFLYWYKVPHSVCFEINLTWVMFFCSCKINQNRLKNTHHEPQKSTVQSLGWMDTMPAFLPMDRQVHQPRL